MVECFVVVGAGVFHARFDLDGTGRALTLRRPNFESASLTSATVEGWRCGRVDIADGLGVRRVTRLRGVTAKAWLPILRRVGIFHQ